MSSAAISREDKKLIIIDFLTKCNDYSADKLSGYEAKLAGQGDGEALPVQQKIHDWTVYRSFNEHAIKELEEGELNSWL